MPDNNDKPGFLDRVLPKVDEPLCWKHGVLFLCIFFGFTIIHNAIIFAGIGLLWLASH